MVDFAPIHRPALAGAKSGLFGSPAPADFRITLTALPEGHVLQVLASSEAGDLKQHLAGLGDGGTHAVRNAGPGQWLVVGDRTMTPTELASAKTTVTASASIVDQSHGRVRIAIDGPPVETVLAKGTAVDTDLAFFPVGMSAMTLIGHISVHLTRTGTKRFELVVLRGFAESLWDDLIQMGLEFGVDARSTGS